jgi:hypothetical protein
MESEVMKKFLEQFKILDKQIDISHGENDSILATLQKELALCEYYRPKLTDKKEYADISDLMSNLTLKVLIFKITGDLQKDVAKLTTRMDELESKLK